MRIGGGDHAEDLFGGEPRGIDAMRRERGVGICHSVGDRFRQRVPPRYRLVPCREAPSAFVLSTEEVVGDRHGQPGRQGDSEPGAQGVVAGEAPGEVALHDNRNTASEVALDLFCRCKQCGEVETHPRFDVRALVHLAPKRLVEGRHGGDEDGLAGSGEHRRDRRLPSAS